MRDRKNVCFFLKQDPDPGSGSAFKILIFRIRIRPKMDRIRNPAWNLAHDALQTFQLTDRAPSSNLDEAGKMTFQLGRWTIQNGFPSMVWNCLGVQRLHPQDTVEICVFHHCRLC